jgi:hypothetical protein
MTLEELRDQWSACNTKLQASLRLNAQLLHESRIRRADSMLRPLGRGIIIELLVNIVAVALLGLFMADHIREPQFLAPALLLDLGAILLVIAGGRQLATLTSLDCSVPVIVLQRQLEALKLFRIRTTKWTLLLAPLLWTPLLIVALKGIFGIDAYADFDKPWLIVNFLVGLAVIPLLLWVSNRFSSRLERLPFVQQLMNDIAGRSLAKTLAFLDSLANLEHEDEQA